MSEAQQAPANGALDEKQMSTIKTATPPMWAAILRLRSHNQVELLEDRCPSLDAWERRGMVCRVDFEGHAYTTTERGRDAADGYACGRLGAKQ